MEMEVKDGKTMRGKIAVERRHQGWQHEGIHAICMTKVSGV